MKINNPFYFVKEHLSGKGLEIGAQANPFQFNTETTTMVYADIRTGDQLREDFKGSTLVDASKIIDNDIIVPDISNLSIIAEKYGRDFDFTCTSHVMEHTPNFLQALEEQLSLIKVGGYVYMIVPDKRFIFDAPRETTHISHISHDYYTGVEQVEIEHYVDFLRVAHPDSTIESMMNDYKNQRSIHVHTFVKESFLEVIEDFCSDLKYEIVSFFFNDNFQPDFKNPHDMHIAVCLKKVA